MMTPDDLEHEVYRLEARIGELDRCQTNTAIAIAVIAGVLIVSVFLLFLKP